MQKQIKTISKEEIDSLKKTLKSKSNELQLLFLSDVSKSKRLSISITDFLNGLFRKLKNILGHDRLLINFYEYLQDEFNIPIQVNLRFLKYDQFQKLFDDWVEFVQRKEQKIQQSLVESQVLDDQTLNQYRNQKFHEILRLKSYYINQYAQTISNKRRLTDFDLNQMFRELFGQYYLYQFQIDHETFFQKINSFSTLLEVLQQYRTTQRNQEMLDDPKFIYVKEIPNILKYWQKINPQLTIEQQQRKNLVSIGIQTQFNQQTIQFGFQQSLQDILNRIIDILNKKKENIVNNQFLKQSIDKIVGVIKKQRIIIYPKYRKIVFFQSFEQQKPPKSILVSNQTKQKIIAQNYKSSINVNNNQSNLPTQKKQKDTNKKKQFQNEENSIDLNPKKLSKILKQIYQYYQNKKIPENNPNFDDKAVRYQYQSSLSEGLLDTKKIHEFLEDIGILKNFQYPKSSKLLMAIKNTISNPNQIMFHQFYAFVNELFAVEPQFTLQKIDNFVKDNIRLKLYSQQQQSFKIQKNILNKSKKLATELPESLIQRVNYSRNYQLKDQISSKIQSPFVHYKQSKPSLNVQKSPQNTNYIQQHPNQQSNTYNKRYLKKSTNQKSIKKSFNSYQYENSPVLILKHKTVKQQIYEKSKLKVNRQQSNSNKIGSNNGYYYGNSGYHGDLS